jgi:hypothetical protein
MRNGVTADVHDAVQIEQDQVVLVEENTRRHFVSF